MFRKFCRSLTLPVIALFVMSIMPFHAVHAGMVETGQVIEQSVAGDARDKVLSTMSRTEVGAKMAAFGISPAEAEARINAMSDAEVVALADRIDKAPAGEGVVGLIIVTALVLAAVLFFTDIAGATDVYSGVGPSK